MLISGNYGAGAIRFLPQFQQNKAFNEASGYIRHGRNTLALGAVASLITAMTLIALDEFTNIHVATHWAVSFAIAPLVATLRLYPAFVAALGGVVRAALPNTLFRPLLMLLTLGGIWVTIPLSYASVAGSYAAAVTLAITVQVVLFIQPLRHLRTRANRTVQPQWRSTGFNLLVTALFLELLVDTVVVLSSLVLPLADTAGLSIVMRLQAIILFGVTSVNMVAGPRLARSHAAGDAVLTNQLLKQTAHLKLWPSIAVYGLLWLAAEPLLAVFGADYVAYADALRIVALTPLVMAVFGPLVLLATVLDLQEKTRNIFFEALLLLVATSVMLGSWLAANGIATAVLLVWIYWHLRLSSTINRAVPYRVAIWASRHS